MVQEQGALRLVDYDGILPRFEGEDSPELGHKHHQHPRRSTQDYHAGMDNFPSLVVYLSLLPLGSDRQLWDRFYNEEKDYMLALINSERRKAGVNPVVLGTNNAAQLHAESSLADCVSSHWGTDGLKPYMRYSLAGGYQSNGENGHGLDYCIKSSES